jgi:hypothetical protein
MVQLARWITVLEPRFVQVWIVQAWNMAYNISVKFPEASDRWRWVEHGIELLRDDALRYNPDEALLYRELAWYYQHKMGMNMDDAHFYYKLAWASEMTRVLASGAPEKFDGRPNYEELLRPTTEEARARATLLRERYKLDPAVMQQVDQLYGPLDWRLPEAHAIYWAHVGLSRSKAQDIITLRRVLYQSMDLACQRGRLKITPNGQVTLAPNLDIIPKTHAAYLEMARQEEAQHLREAIKKAHRNFLRRAVYDLYIHNRLAEAAQWFKTLRELYSDGVPADMTLTDYALSRVMGEVEQGTQVKMNSLLIALVTQSYLRLVEDQDDEAAAYMQRAQELYDGYGRKTGGSQRLAITPLPEVKKEVLDQLLSAEGGLTPEGRARLRGKLGLPAPPTG